MMCGPSPAALRSEHAAELYPPPPPPPRSPFYGPAGFGLQKGDKAAWPECVGLSGESCKALIEKERPNLQVFVGPAGGIYTADFRDDRVRVLIDEKSETVAPPRIG